MCCGKENKKPVRYSAGQMNRQMFISYPAVKQPYFYATKQGGGNGIEFEAASNFDGSHLDDSLLHSMGRFSSADGLETGEYEASDDEKTDSDIDSSDYGSEDEQESEDEDNTDSEESDEEGVDEQDLPKFRNLVRNKKLELKAQYGKTRIVMKKKCKKVKLPKAYTERECKSFCTAWYTLTRDGHHAGDCKNREEVCVNVPKVRMVEKNVCIKIPKKQWGWRKRWREFKKNGGLAQLRLKAKGLNPPPISSPSTTTYSTNAQVTTTPTSIVINKPFVIKTPNKKLEMSNQPDKFGKGKKEDKEVTSSSKENSSETSEKKFLGSKLSYGIGAAVVLAIGTLAYFKLRKK